MMRVKRYFLELKKFDKENFNLNLPKNFKFILDKKRDFQLNRFFYKNVGSDHYWRDRLSWTENQWAKYVNNINFETWVLKFKNDFVGFYEQEFHPQDNEVELINMGILKEFRGKKLGSLLLSHSISQAFKRDLNRMWVHTCSLDHKFALQNYKSRGFRIFKEEEIDFVA